VVVGEQFDIPKQRQYTDYKELIYKEQPDLVSVATQPEHRAEIVINAEKVMTASMVEADAMVEACERKGVFFNLGTQRRWDRGFTKMREILEVVNLVLPRLSSCAAVHC